MNRFVLVASIAALPAAIRGQAPHVERSKRGDTTILRTTGNGIWGAPRPAVEIKRVGGESNETTFGRVYTTQPLPNGGVLLFDEKALDGPALRMFDADARFARNVGRKGSGPGEFVGNGTTVFNVGSDGTIILREYNGLLNRYRADGTFLNAFRFELGAGGALDIYPGAHNTTYIRAGLPPNMDRTKFTITDVPMRHYDSTGKVLDSIIVPSYIGAPPKMGYEPREWWFPLPDGRQLQSRTDRTGFLLRSGAGGRSLLLVDLPGPGPLFDPEERRERQAVADFTHEQSVHMPGGATPAYTVPERKLPSLTAFADLDGRIWVKRSTTGVKGTPRVVASFGRGADGKPTSISTSYEDLPFYSAFRLDGTYLGDVSFPKGTTAISFAGDHAWGMLPSADDQPMLVKFKLPGGR